MTGAHARRFVLVSDYRVPDPQRVFPLLQSRKSELADIGAQDVVVHASTWDYGRVLVSIAIESQQPVVDLIRSRVFFDWFDAAGVQDIRGVFVGELIDKIDSTSPLRDGPPGILVAAMTAVEDVPLLVRHVHQTFDSFKAAGIHKMWIYEAFDDEHEVLIFQEIEDEQHARRWVQQPDTAADWIAGAGVGAYPPLFVGKFVAMMHIDGPN